MFQLQSDILLLYSAYSTLMGSIRCQPLKWKRRARLPTNARGHEQMSPFPLGLHDALSCMGGYLTLPLQK